MFDTTTLRFAAATALLFGSTNAYHERRQVGSDVPQVVVPGASSYNGLNLIPQMGWNNWNAFHCDVNESLLLSTAQDMVDYGLRDLGYDHIVLDDCWAVGRNESGYLVADGACMNTLTPTLFTHMLSRQQISQRHEIHR
tara:strand:+ start:2863 stop:3279 length:417 start_codon:yes stop_codon:yes gene_type:complete